MCVAWEHLLHKRIISHIDYRTKESICGITSVDHTLTRRNIADVCLVGRAVMEKNAVLEKRKQRKKTSSGE